MRLLGRVILFGAGLLCSIQLVHAQAILSTSFVGEGTPLTTAPPDSIVQLVAESQGLAPIDPADLPAIGTYWWVVPCGTAIPMPCPPYDQILPIYKIADGQFLVDQTGGQVAVIPHRRLRQTATLSPAIAVADAVTAETESIVALIDQIQTEDDNRQLGTMAMSLGVDLPSFGDGGGTGDGGLSPAYTGGTWIDTNALYLQITNHSGGWAYLNLCKATNQVYAILTTTNLATPSAGWQVETELFPIDDQTNILPFAVSNLDPQHLFIRAEDWTGKDSNGDGIPDWWAWKYFGNLNQSTNSDYDGDGTNILTEYLNGVDPNKVSFSLSFLNQYVNGGSAVGTVTILGGVPAAYAVLVDSTNLSSAIWTNYTSPYIAINLGSTQGAHDVRVGLRGRPANAYQTWQETTLVMDSTMPTIAITSPADGLAFNASRVNISGNFNGSSVRQIAVNGVTAFVNGTNFEAVNVPLAAGTNLILASIMNLTGITNTTSISLLITTNSDGSLNDPVQLRATPTAGFAPLPVAFSVQANAPGSFVQATYDFNGDDLADYITNNLNSITTTYATNGEFFPFVTIQTDVGHFSSVGGWNAVALDSSNQPIQINVQSAPTMATFASITDPVDIKWVAPSNLYILSGSTATITEFGTNGSLIRSLSGIGNSPSGLDVDTAGNVYVAMTGDNKVFKFIPTTNSFLADTNFGNNGFIGVFDGDAAGDVGQFKAPFDVAVSPDGGTIAVSDSGNNRIQQFMAENGVFIAAFGSSGSAIGQFSAPKGLAYDAAGLLYIVDSGNNRIVTAQGTSVVGVTGTGGTDLEQFNSPVNLCVGERGVYVADTGNNRIQSFNRLANGVYSFAPTDIRFAVSTNFNQPAATAAVGGLTNELFYVADTGNNRVVLCNAPGDSPDDILAVWNSMTNYVVMGDIIGAISCFSIASSHNYQQAFLSLGMASAISAVNQIGPLTPVYIKNDTAEYYFTNTIDGQTLTFPVDFVKENGQWKILEF